MSVKNYNKLALQGLQQTDADVCKTMGIDISLANTPKINSACLNKVYDDNVKGFMSRGMNWKQAKAKAGKLRSEANKQIQRMLKGFPAVHQKPS